MAMPRSGKVSLRAVFPSDRTPEPSGVFVHLVLSSCLCFLWRCKFIWVHSWWWWCLRALRTWDTFFLLWFWEKQNPNDFYCLEDREGARYSEHFQYSIFFSFSMLNFTLFFQARHGAQSLALPVCSKMLSWDQACLWLELCNRLTVDWCFPALPKLPWGVQQSMSMLVLVRAFFFSGRLVWSMDAGFSWVLRGFSSRLIHHTAFF